MNIIYNILQSYPKILLYYNAFTIGTYGGGDNIVSYVFMILKKCIMYVFETNAAVFSPFGIRLFYFLLLVRLHV